MSFATDKMQAWSLSKHSPTVTEIPDKSSWNLQNQELYYQEYT